MILQMATSAIVGACVALGCVALGAHWWRRHRISEEPEPPSWTINEDVLLMMCEREVEVVLTHRFSNGDYRNVARLEIAPALQKPEVVMALRLLTTARGE